MKRFTVVALLFLFTMTLSLRAQRIKVVAYNVEFAKSTTPQEMAGLLSTFNADVICFSEVPKGWTAKVAQLLGFSNSFEGDIASAHHVKGFEDKTGSFSGKYKSILSKYPLKNTREYTFSGKGWSPAGAVKADIMVKENKSLTVFSLHVPTGKKNPDNCKANDLARIIAEEYANTSRIVLAGDFNDNVDTPPLQRLYNLGFLDCWTATNLETSGKTTFLGEQEAELHLGVIDQIMFRGVKVKKAKIVEEDSPLSDHKPVWAVLKI